MAISLAHLNLDELDRLRQQADTLMGIRLQHQQLFIVNIGTAALEVLAKAPKVEAEQLRLHHNSKYHEGCAKPDQMDESIVRGVDSLGRPFVAMKLDLWEKARKVTQVVEIVFLRFEPGTFGNRYVTTLTCLGADGKTYSSGLYSSGGMQDYQMKRVGDLLTGHKINHEFDERYQLQLAT